MDYWQQDFLWILIRIWVRASHSSMGPTQTWEVTKNEEIKSLISPEANTADYWVVKCVLVKIVLRTENWECFYYSRPGDQGSQTGTTKLFISDCGHWSLEQRENKGFSLQWSEQLVAGGIVSCLWLELKIFETTPGDTRRDSGVLALLLYCHLWHMITQHTETKTIYKNNMIQCNCYCF